MTGVDVSHWNGTVPFIRLRAAGHRFVIAKASQGSAFVDPLFVRHRAAARAAGLVTGAYHFFDPRVDGVAQAEHFLGVIAPDGTADGVLAPVIDVECFAPFGPVPRADAVARLRAMTDTIHARTGRYPMIYTSRSMWQRMTGGDPGFGHLPLWVACWRCRSPILPAGWTSFAIWQVGAFIIPGRGRRIDGNVMPGGEEALARLVGRPLVVDGGGVTARSRVAIDLGSLDGAEVRTAVGGSAWSAWGPRRDRIRVALPEADGPTTIAVQLRDPRGTAGPVVERMVTIDRTPPVVSMRAGRPVAGLVVADDGSAAVALDVRAHDTGSGLAAVRITPGCGDERIATGDVSLALMLAPGVPCTVQATGTDAAGNVSAATPLRLALDLVDPVSSGAAGPPEGWVERPRDGAVGGSHLLAVTPGAPLEVQVAGSMVAIVAPRGPFRGRLEVRVDQGAAMLVDLYAATRTSREVVWARRLATGGGHTLTIVATGAAAPGSRGRRVAIDAVLGLAVERVPVPVPG